MHRRRIRSIKPEMFTDEKFIELSARAQLMFIGLISYADDEGRFAADVRQIAGALCLGRLADDAKATLSAVEAEMAEIAAAGMLRLYTVDGRRYGDLPGWSNHQRVDKPQPSEYPPFEPGAAVTAQNLDLSRHVDSNRDTSRHVENDPAGSGSGSRSGADAAARVPAPAHTHEDAPPPPTPNPGPKTSTNSSTDLRPHPMPVKAPKLPPSGDTTIRDRADELVRGSPAADRLRPLAEVAIEVTGYDVGIHTLAQWLSGNYSVERVRAGCAFAVQKYAGQCVPEGTVINTATKWMLRARPDEYETARAPSGAPSTRPEHQLRPRLVEPIPTPEQAARSLAILEEASKLFDEPTTPRERRATA